jgi:hypothetical protein
MYLAINILLANDVVKFPFTVDVFNLRDVAWLSLLSVVVALAPKRYHDGDRQSSSSPSSLAGSLLSI